MGQPRVLQVPDDWLTAAPAPVERLAKGDVRVRQVGEAQLIALAVHIREGQLGPRMRDLAADQQAGPRRPPPQVPVRRHLGDFADVSLRRPSAVMAGTMRAFDAPPATNPALSTERTGRVGDGAFESGSCVPRLE